MTELERNHPDQSSVDKELIEQAEQSADQGPNFGTPGAPPPADNEKLTEIEQGFEDANDGERTPRSS